MDSKLRIRTYCIVALTAAAVILALLLSIYVNDTASSGGEASAVLNITSGDPSVLAGLSFSVWSNQRAYPDFYDEYENEYLYGKKEKDPFEIKSVDRDTVSFDETGQPDVTRCVQQYTSAPGEYSYSDVFGFRDSRLNLEERPESGEWELSISNSYNSFWENPIIPGFQIDSRIREVTRNEGGSATLGSFIDVSCVSYMIDGIAYFTITQRKISEVIRDAYYPDRDVSPLIDESYDIYPEYRAFSFTTGIFRSDGKTVENVLPNMA